MKSILHRLLLPLLLFAGLAVPAHAQYGFTGDGGGYVFGTVTAVGPLGLPISFINSPTSPSAHTIDWSNAGTAATACTFELGGSNDGSHWHSLSGIQSCANFTVTGTVASGSQSVTGVSSTQYMLPGQTVTGTCLAAGASIATVGANTFTLSANATSSGTCTITVGAGYGMLHLPYKPVKFLRLNVLSYTAGDGTTAVTFNYDRGN